MKLNNTKKAIISAIAGAALLAGTAGTFALWQDTEAIGNQTIVTGNLELSLSGDSWNYINRLGYGTSGYGSTQAITPATIWTTADRLVPGTQIQQTLSADVTLVGTDLVAELRINGQPITINGDGYLINGSTPTQLRADINVEGATLVDGVHRLTPADVEAPDNTITITLTVTFVPHQDARTPYDTEFTAYVWNALTNVTSTNPVPPATLSLTQVVG